MAPREYYAPREFRNGGFHPAAGSAPSSVDLAGACGIQEVPMPHIVVSVPEVSVPLVTLAVVAVDVADVWLADVKLEVWVVKVPDVPVGLPSVGYKTR